ncbi:MAG TPA: hypothetical protein VGM90_40815 [Kofleriaceae bacterium]|jgi:hypothetical protein
MIVERQDIDALLISALYGELTPSQESELTAHLASHPGDKLALEGLTATRDAIRSSRIMAVQAEPPQSITAMLIREAARRAPKAPAEGEGWFGRFVRSFVQHPAMAAAATLVLVIGIAAVVGRNKGNEFAQETADRSLAAPSAAMQKHEDQQAVAPAEGVAAGSDMKFDVAQRAEPAPTVAIGSSAGSGSAVADGYLDTGVPHKQVAMNAKGDANAEHAGDRMGMAVTLADEQRQGSKIATANGIALDRRAQQPKDFASDDKKAPEKESLRSRDELQKAKKQDADKNENLADGESWGTDSTVTTVTKAPGTGAAGGAAPTPPPPPPPAQPTPVYATPPAGPARTFTTSPTTPTISSAPQNAPAKTQAPRVVAPVSPAPAAVEPPKPEPKAEAKKPAPAKAEKTLEEKPAETSKSDVAKSDPTTEWAKAQHASLVAKARGNDCNAAADLAVQIENRAPGYYAQFVANDRDLKTCQSTITAAREKEAEKRAAVERSKKATGAEPKAAKKADTKATSTESTK